ncbi:aminopeptidase N [Ningiella sp. W23]|uniref:aminopeptidase N n=1 Tax=Ningiella sp. W23 TaxID=3023715 RepID=UPI0037581A63
MTSTMLAKRREDYRPAAFEIDSVNLSFELHPSATIVKNTMVISRKDDTASEIVLDGESLTLLTLTIDGKEAQAGKDYHLSDESLSIKIAGATCTLEITNRINPQSNTSLEGLYFVSDAFCTQCEAQGFRKITYFLDRPDVLSIFTVSIISDDPKLKYLLSNGNKLADEVLENGKRQVIWHDPHRKPCYLFALVAGDFDCLSDRYVTSEGRDVTLEVFVDKGRLHQANHAMASLKKSMQWDEQTFGLAYDLDIYMIVAVDFFNMGAMENKGLNVFNSKFVLADPTTATDEDYFNIESIIAHEYFHNWTGNRVTCRDWFQLSLKEGLTVFRDQKFSEDASSQLACRIKQVKVMREHQFAEDAGPTSHPIRPDEVMEMNNFYTVTVYDKGAEVIRMLYTMLSANGFKKGLALYFKRHDGQAVTCDDFVNAMQDANDEDLSHFKRWYSQSGTPLVKVRKVDDGYEVAQLNLPTADQAEKQTLSIPLTFSVLDEHGTEHFLGESENSIITLRDELTKIPIPQDILKDSAGINALTPVLLADFSAPVKLDFAYSATELLHIIQYAKSHYAKWDACQTLYSQFVVSEYTRQIEGNEDAQTAASGDKLRSSIASLIEYLEKAHLPFDVTAQMLILPGFETLATGINALSPLNLHHAIEHVRQQLAQTCEAMCLRILTQEPLMQAENFDYQYEQAQVNARSLKSECLKLLSLSCLDESSPASQLQLNTRYKQADNMTDKLMVLQAAQQSNIEVFDQLMSLFESEYGDDAVVMDKWFALHATAQRSDILARLDLLRAHGQFSIKNPNKVRALIGSFAFYNHAGFHAPDGSGYKYVVDYLIELDDINPQVAARIVTPLLQAKRYAQSAKSKMLEQIKRLLTKQNISKDLFEKLSKTLSDIEHD